MGENGPNNENDQIFPILDYSEIKARCAWKGRSTGCFLKVILLSEASGMYGRHRRFAISANGRHRRFAISANGRQSK